MKQIEHCINFLSKNDYIITDKNNEYTSLIHKEKYTNISAIDISEKEIVFINDTGDWLHIPCHYYALIGALLHFNQISINYKR